MSKLPAIRIAVLGAGTMGHGIALVLAAAGHAVRLMDMREDVLADAVQRIQRESVQLSAHGLLTEEQVAAIPGRIESGTGLAWAVEGTGLVVEAVPERLDIKRRIFGELDQVCSPETILASNSSAIPISDIARDLHHPERAVGWHWFAPAHLVPLIEVVQGRDTAEVAVERLRDFTVKIGRIPIVVRRDVPGFVANRLQHALMREVLNLLDAGIASAEDLDLAVRYSFGVRLLASGPLEQRDFAGLDVHHAAATRIYPTLSNAEAPDGQLEELVRQGDLGIKTGRGFYDWTETNRDEVLQDRDERLLAAVQLLRSFDGRQQTVDDPEMR